MTVSYTHLDVYKRQAEGGAIPQMTSAENVDTPLTETEQSAEIEGSTLNESNNLSETDFTGRYVDDLGTGCLLYTSRCV